MHLSLYAGWAALATAALSAAVPVQAQNQIFGAGYSAPWVKVAPGQVLTLFTPALNVPDAVATGTPLPNSLSGVSVLVRVPGAKDTRGYPTSLPILRVYTANAGQLADGTPCPTNPNTPICSNTQITVEIPTEGVCEPNGLGGNPLDTCTAPPFHNQPVALLLNVVANGVTGPDFPLQMIFTQGYAPHLLTSCDSIFGPRSANGCVALITHADGTLVNGGSPAKVGETVTTYAVGLGLGGLTPLGFPIRTGYAPSAPVQFAPASYSLVVFTYPAASIAPLPTTVQASARPDWVGLVPGYVGLYQINVTVPPMPGAAEPAGTCGTFEGVQTGNATITLNFLPANTLSICVQP